METTGEGSEVSGCGFTIQGVSTFCYFVFNRTPREIELDNDFDKLTAVLTRMLHQVKVWVWV